MNKQEKFKELVGKLKELHYLSGLTNLAVWDQQVYLPSGGAVERGEQIGLLAKVRHERANDPALFDLVQELSARSDLTDEEKVVVNETLRDLTKERKKPAALIQALASAESESHTAWLEARSKKQFSLVVNQVKKILELKKEYAQAINSDLSIYDTLVDDFERDARSKDIFDRFSQVKSTVIDLLAKQPSDSFSRTLRLPVKIDKQTEFFTKLATKIGFDFERGRIDKTVHPFMALAGSSDVRLTARFKEDDLFYGLFGFLHEMGHGIYEQGMNPNWTGTPLSENCSLVVHESQSLLFEKQLGFSREFQDLLLKELQNQFPNDTRKYTAEALYQNWNTSKLSLIRLESSELGYALHIILRTELESKLFDGDLSFADLPDAWREKCQEYFGMEPADDLEGCLQDVHWYSGLFGYFPHYLGGAMYAAQLMDTFKASKKTSLATEEGVKELLEWLRKKVHSQGRTLTANKLLQKITGAELSAESYLKYLKQSI
jgi:carboxypeptidase Taq